VEEEVHKDTQRLSVHLCVPLLPLCG